MPVGMHEAIHAVGSDAQQHELGSTNCCCPLWGKQQVVKFWWSFGSAQSLDGAAPA